MKKVDVVVSALKLKICQTEVTTCVEVCRAGEQESRQEGDETRDAGGPGGLFG